MDEAIVAYMKRKYNLAIGEQTAERIKTTIGNAYPLEQQLTRRSRAEHGGGHPQDGRGQLTRCGRRSPRRFNAIVEAVLLALERTPGARRGHR
jgi:rod shape-determining protein MreB